MKSKFIPILCFFVIVTSYISKVHAEVTATTGGIVEVSQDVFDNSEFISTPFEVEAGKSVVYGLGFSTTDGAQITGIKIGNSYNSATEYDVTYFNGVYTIQGEAGRNGANYSYIINRNRSINVYFSVTGPTTITLTQWANSERNGRNYILVWDDYDNSDELQIKLADDEESTDDRDRLQILSTTPESKTYFLDEVSNTNNSTATNNLAGGDMKFMISGENLSPGQSISITFKMNDYAAENLRAIYVYGNTRSDKFTINRNAISNNTLTYSNTGSWTVTGYIFEPNVELDMKFQLFSDDSQGRPIEPGLAKIWISRVIFNGITLNGSESNATYINMVGERPQVAYVVEQDKSYVGAGNKNEPLFRVRGDFSGDGSTTIKFTPYFDEGLVERLVIFLRKVPTEGDVFYGDGFDDIGIFDYRHPLKNTNDKVAYAGYIPAPISSGQQIEFTIPQSAYNINLHELLQSGEYYIYLTADISSEATEFAGDGYNTRMAVGAKLDQLIVNDNAVDFQHVSYSNNEIEYIEQQERSRIVLKQRSLLYRPYDGYSKYYRIPAITTTDDGTLITTSDARKYHNHDTPNDFDILSCYSVDEGKTWSEHTIIAKGTGWSDNGLCSDDNVLGFGDCAIAELSTPGNVLAIFIGGAGLRSPRGDGPTVYYNKSITSGASWWAQPKMIPQNIIDAGSGQGVALTNAVACPGPGRMCLIKNSGTSLDDKAISCIYVWNHGYFTHCPLNFLSYDETTDTWANVGTFPYSANLSPGESQLTQISDRKLILTCRDQSGQQVRTWHLVNITDDGRLVVERQLSYSNFSTAAGACNSNFIVYEAGGKKYLIQAMPVSTTACIGTDTSPTRQNIWVKYADLTDIIAGNSTHLNWQDGINITLNQGTGGYSCLTRQLDGSIGIMVEEYPIAYRNVETDHHCNNGTDVLLASWYMSTTFESITNGKIISDEIRVIPAPIILPSSRGFTIDDNGYMEHWTHNDSGLVEIIVDKSQIQINQGEHFVIEYSVMLETGNQSNDSEHISHLLTANNSMGADNSDVFFNLKETLNKYLEENSIVLAKGDAITVTARTFIHDQNDQVVAYSPNSYEVYEAVHPGRHIMVKVMPASFNMNPRLITTIGEYEKDTEVIVAQEDVITLHQGTIPADALAKFLGFSVNPNTFEPLDNNIFNVTTFDDVSQINLTVPTVETFQGDPDNNNLITFYAWYSDLYGGVYQKSTVIIDAQNSMNGTNAIFDHCLQQGQDIDNFDLKNDLMDYPENQVNINESDLIYGYKGWYEFSNIDIDLVADKYTYRRSAVVMFWYLNPVTGLFECDKDSNGNVFFRNIYGLNSAASASVISDNPHTRPTGVDGQGNPTYAPTNPVAWYSSDDYSPSPAKITIPTGKLLDGIAQNATVGKIITYIVEKPISPDEANEIAINEVARINTPETSRSTSELLPLDSNILYLIEQEISTNTMTSIDRIVDNLPFEIDGNKIIATQDAKIYNLQGLQVKSDNLQNGIYIVVIDGISYKVVINN